MSSILVLGPGLATVGLTRRMMNFDGQADHVEYMVGPENKKGVPHWYVGEAEDGVECFGGHEYKSPQWRYEKIMDLPKPLLVVGFSEGSSRAQLCAAFNMTSWVSFATVSGGLVRIPPVYPVSHPPMIHFHGLRDRKRPVSGGRIKVGGPWWQRAKVPSVQRIQDYFGTSMTVHYTKHRHEYTTWHTEQILKWWRENR